MIYTIIYRNSKTGQREALELDVSSKEDVWPVLRERGISAISVNAGRISKASRYSSPRLNPGAGSSTLRGIVAGLIIVVVAGLALWLIHGGGESTDPQAEPQSDEKTESKRVHQTEADAGASQDQPQRHETQAVVEQSPRFEETVVEPQLPTNVFRTSRGTVELLAPPKSHETKGRRPISENEVHCMIANYIRPGVPMPPPEPVSDKDALEACSTPILDLDDDDAYTKEVKECVRGMVKNLEGYLQEGKSANEFFRDLEHRQEMEAIAVQTTRKEVLDRLREGKIEEAKMALEIFNKHLNEEGIPSVRVKQLDIILKEQNQ